MSRFVLTRGRAAAFVIACYTASFLALRAWFYNAEAINGVDQVIGMTAEQATTAFGAIIFTMLGFSLATLLRVPKPLEISRQ